MASTMSGGIFPARFVEPFGAVQHAAGHDQRPGLGAGRGEAALHEEFVETEFIGRRAWRHQTDG